MNTHIHRRKTAIVFGCITAIAGCTCVVPVHENESKPILHGAGVGADCNGPMHAGIPALREVIETECAFAKTMADRDLKTFAAFLDDDAVFFDKDGPLFGKDSVLKAWKPYFDGPKPPFSWEPTQATWNGKGLAYTTGPVWDSGGKCVARFNSIWRKQADGHWRIVFDKGDGKCDPTVIPGGGKRD